MKLKIVQKNQDSRGGEQQVTIKEELETEQMEEAVTRVSPEDKPTKEKYPPLVPSPVSVSNPILVYAKRKRKPKELINEVSPIIEGKKRKSSASKSRNGTPDGRGTSMSKRDANAGGSVSPIQTKSPTMIQAEEVHLSLGADQPTFLKALVRSHVASCFWMGLPVPFCRTHLPSKDTTVVLENEDGEEFPIKYIAHKTGLSAGWRKFVAGNKLLEGDVLIFQLIGPCSFKVYIIRANDLTEVDGALSLLILDSQTKQNDNGHYNAERSIDVQSKWRRHPKSLPLTLVPKKKQKEDLLGLQVGQPEEHSGNDSDEVASEVLEDTKFTGSFLHFKDVKSFEEFHIVVNGACIDSELPGDTRRKFYELCCSQNTYLHERLLPGLYSKLVAGMIAETINICDRTRGCKLTTPRKDFEVWEKTLRSFELLGLNVGFLRARLCRLLSLAFDSEVALEIRRYWEAQKELGHTEDEIQKLEAKLIEVKELSAKYDHEIENLKSKAENYEFEFQEEAEAPW